ncbi:hypothetical protein QUF84_10555 [Fictibacillus enclensis]|uniref:Uncharacterized protein n=2 Tax=Fictibacillus TaxID=1329200 RepID=A0A0V8JCR3_9BACL|nr:MULTISPECIES: hypothetical protein [Fictibacillus]KSU84714.1 hypothetical protein AS030_04050 [Fictibacillus enclensis]MDM5198458.1 hypothetical protein [Fictibacillus enclensis]MDM5337658.1 hypothetical protein [Fictibacillus enclensis]RXY99634.1 hypothetical protein DMO16_08050 [Fictibacillus sp. S7]WHY74024.1 hypothetical protein QNH15_09020 [Fictibacillus enclensis]
MNKITLGLPPHCHKVSFDGKVFKIKGFNNEKMVVPVSGTESAEVRQVNEETGMLNIVGKDRILISMEMPLRFCEIGKGWLLDKLPKRKKKK